MTATWRFAWRAWHVRSSWASRRVALRICRHRHSVSSFVAKVVAIIQLTQSEEKSKGRESSEVFAVLQKRFLQEVSWGSWRGAWNSEVEPSQPSSHLVQSAADTSERVSSTPSCRKRCLFELLIVWRQHFHVQCTVGLHYSFPLGSTRLLERKRSFWNHIGGWRDDFGELRVWGYGSKVSMSSSFLCTQNHLEKITKVVVFGNKDLARTLGMRKRCVGLGAWTSLDERPCRYPFDARRPWPKPPQAAVRCFLPEKTLFRWVFRWNCKAWKSGGNDWRWRRKHKTSWMCDITRKLSINQMQLQSPQGRVFGRVFLLSHCLSPKFYLIFQGRICC